MVVVQEIELQCTMLIKGAVNPDEDRCQDLFTVELTPKNMMLPEGFCIWNSNHDVENLEEYLNSGVDDYDWNGSYHGEPEEDEFIAKLPAPLSNVDADFVLKWTMQDVAFDKAAYVLCKIFHTYHTQEMLEKKSVGELRIIARVVGAHLADKKPKLIHNIQMKQSEGAWGKYGLPLEVS
jgi:hypothetical protein